MVSRHFQGRHQDIGSQTIYVAQESLFIFLLEVTVVEEKDLDALLSEMQM